MDLTDGSANVNKDSGCMAAPSRKYGAASAFVRHVRGIRLVRQLRSHQGQSLISDPVPVPDRQNFPDSGSGVDFLMEPIQQPDEGIPVLFRLFIEEFRYQFGIELGIQRGSLFAFF